MKGYHVNIEELSLKNEYFREVLYTDERVQLVVMSLLPEEEIGEEVHMLNQFIRVEGGKGKCIMDGEECEVEKGSALIIPAGLKHNIINTSQQGALKLYTLYAPPNHVPGTVHKTKAEADAAERQEHH